MSKFIATSILAASAVNGLQHVEQKYVAVEKVGAHQPPKPPWYAGWFTQIDLDPDETKARGSLCLDGLPGAYFLHKSENETNANKWILAIPGGLEWCGSAESCADQAGISRPRVGADGNNLYMFQTDEFKDYNHVVFHHCDGGLGMGNREDPVEHDGQLYYLRGRRVIDHSIDDLIASHGFGTAEEVLLTGGSGGGQQTYVIADHIGTRLPKSVKKYGAAPMNGWWSSTQLAHQSKEGVELHNMSSAFVPACREALDEKDEWKCVYTDLAYNYSKTPMFPIQLLDHLTLCREAPGNVSVFESWHTCMFNDNEKCDSAGVAILNELVDVMQSGFQNSAKAKKPDAGGFVSTCSRHIFFISDEYANFAVDGVTVHQALWKWWQELGTGKDDNWHWPCQINDAFPHQCERSCDYGTDGKDQQVNDGFAMAWRMHA